MELKVVENVAIPVGSSVLLNFENVSGVYIAEGAVPPVETASREYTFRSVLVRKVFPDGVDGYSGLT